MSLWSSDLNQKAELNFQQSLSRRLEKGVECISSNHCTEVEVLDLNPTTDAEEVKAAVQSYFKISRVVEIKVSLTQRPFRGNLKAFEELIEELAGRLLRTGHLKVARVSCRVQKKTESVRCYRCLGFNHMAAGCESPDRNKVCWRCGKEGHRAASCENTLQCYLCANKEGNPRTHHHPGTIRGSTFREAASSKKPTGRSR
ncbi:uncharacterized protein LOC117173659 [Belonocnema kinseyi]|uniref:uncharacterized protein LOC117173659 n=1 Tax=Belonocnema kinseyi TaxID=2817044 RepID=UPI00143CC836|nr:uncharacterized protein LOC117173659 [Belonocnema kinseyi]